MVDELKALRDLLNRVDPEIRVAAQKGATAYSLKGEAESALAELRRRLGYEQLEPHENDQEKTEENNKLDDHQLNPAQKALKSYSNTSEINQRNSVDIDKA